MAELHTVLRARLVLGERQHRGAVVDHRSGQPAQQTGHHRAHDTRRRQRELLQRSQPVAEVGNGGVAVIEVVDGDLLEEAMAGVGRGGEEAHDDGVVVPHEVAAHDCGVLS